MGLLLVFDGDCGFCTTSARWMERRFADRPGRSGRPVEVVPWQRLDLDELGLTRHDVETAAYWIDGTRTARGHRGVGHAFLEMGGAWRIAGGLCLIPPFSWAAAIIYRLIARFRHRMPGGTPACRIGEGP